jgi:effector-binding domain-containing protein
MLMNNSVEICPSKTKKQETLAIRATIPYSEVAEHLNLLWQELGRHIAVHKIQTSGAPYCLYHHLGPSSVDLECGFPVSGFAPEGGRVKRSEIPAAKCVTAVHEGPYETLAQTYQEMQAWMQSKKLIPGKIRWEFYLVGPLQEKDSGKWKTQVFWPVEGRA